MLERNSNNLAFAVYPETKGVPLEEMDAVFGEGSWADSCIIGEGSHIYAFAEEREEELEYGPETESLVPSQHSGHDYSTEDRHVSSNNRRPGWLSKILGRPSRREHYEPIRDE